MDKSLKNKKKLNLKTESDSSSNKPSFVYRGFLNSELSNEANQMFTILSKGKGTDKRIVPIFERYNNMFFTYNHELYFDDKNLFDGFKVIGEVPLEEGGYPYEKLNELPYLYCYFPKLDIYGYLCEYKNNFQVLLFDENELDKLSKLKYKNHSIMNLFFRNAVYYKCEENVRYKELKLFVLLKTSNSDNYVVLELNKDLMCINKAAKAIFSDKRDKLYLLDSYPRIFDTLEEAEKCFRECVECTDRD